MSKEQDYRRWWRRGRYEFYLEITWGKRAVHAGANWVPDKGWPEGVLQ